MDVYVRRRIEIIRGFEQRSYPHAPAIGMCVGAGTRYPGTRGYPVQLDAYANVDLPTSQARAPGRYLLCIPVPGMDIHTGTYNSMQSRDRSVCVRAFQNGDCTVGFK